MVEPALKRGASPIDAAATLQGRSIDRMHGSPFHNLVDHVRTDRTLPTRASIVAPVASVLLHRTDVDAALRATRFGPRLLVGLGGLGEVEAFDGPFARPTLRRPVLISPSIKREGNRI
jgi:hypothetical protein